MKRHPLLIPLSREHHEVLILSQLIQKDDPQYRGLPDTVEGKRVFALNMFQRNIRPHFEKEEVLFKKLTGYHTTIETITAVVLAEHRQLEKIISTAGATGTRCCRTG